MTRRRKVMAAAAVSVIAGVVAVASMVVAPALASGSGDDELPEVCERSRRGDRIATAKLIIEFNSTDDDIGVHGAFDDHGWSELCVFDPTGNPIAVFDPRGQLDDLTMAGVFFESREPPGDEYSMEDLAAAFPEGRYRVRARTFEGRFLTGAATFTHDVPAPPVITAPMLAEDAEQPGPPVAREGFEVQWDDVTETVDGELVTVTGYEVILTKEHHDDPHGFSKPVYDVHVPASLNSLSVPAEFLEPGTVYEVEVLALEESGNQTITVGFFVTER